MIVEGELQELEQRLTMPGATETRASLALLLAAEFREFNSAGRVCDASEVLDGLLAGGRPRVVLEDFNTQSIAPGSVLITYVAKTLAGAGWRPPALSSSLWSWRDQRWQRVFHQGTPLPAAKT